MEFQCFSARMCLMVHICMTFTANSVALTTFISIIPSGLLKSTAKGLNQTHQEPAKTRPQLKLQTHPPRLQECGQRPVSLCHWRVRVCVLNVSSVAAPFSFFPLYLMAGSLAHCRQLATKPPKPESPIISNRLAVLNLLLCHTERGAGQSNTCLCKDAC